jgi:hypothetical protein
MNTKHKLEKQAAQLKADLDKLNETIASMKDELPEGFVPFEATANSKCPCHMNDDVEVIRKDGARFKRQAFCITWQVVFYDDRFTIASYKIVKKYVEPRPMKFSELPVGQWFMWSNGMSEDASVYMKTNRTDLSSVCIKGGGFCEIGRSTNFSENLNFYGVNKDMTRGELLVVQQPPEPVEDEFYMHKLSGPFCMDSRYLMGRRPDGVWFILEESGERFYEDAIGNTIGKSSQYDSFVKEGIWVKTTPEQAFKR